MSKSYLIEAKPWEAETALCETCEHYISLEAAEGHMEEDHIITWLRSEVA